MIALDLFAGHGWGVACQRLGIEEYGVEIMPEAVATRTANGMTTIYNDVWKGLAPLDGGKIVTNNVSAPGNSKDRATNNYGKYARGVDLPSPTVTGETGRWYREVDERLEYSILIASPPCQTFSMAGGGAGRRALDDVLEAITSRAYLDPAKLREFGEKHDPRTALVLTPLAHVARDTPMFVVFEQVPPVLPVWEACAEVMRRWGYSVWTGNLQAEMYGVPQTRKRAILIARADGIEAAPPVPTHSRYYSRDPKRLDPGVKPWVSMAEALGWGMTERPFVTASNSVGRGEREAEEPAPPMTSKADRNKWVVTGGATTEMHTPRTPEDPAPPITGAGNTYYGEGERFTRDELGRKTMSPSSRSVTIEEAAALQSYPPGFTFSGTKTKQFLQVGNAVPPLLAEAILKGFLS